MADVGCLYQNNELYLARATVPSLKLSFSTAPQRRHSLPLHVLSWGNMLNPYLWHVPQSCIVTLIALSLLCFSHATGMTVEVLGTVLGTAIQGQIVGGAIAPCLRSELDTLSDLNSTQLGLEVNVSGISLNDTVSEETEHRGVCPPTYLLLTW